MGISINIGGDVHTLIVNGSPAQRVVVDGVQVWSAGQTPTELVFVITDDIPSVDIAIIQTAAHAVTVDWGDGSSEETSASQSANFSHMYDDNGMYTVKIYCQSGESWIFGRGSLAVSPNITAARFSGDVTAIGNYALDNCTLLTEVVMPSSLSSIGTYAFRNTRITSVAIPEGVTGINATTFIGCVSLVSVVISANVSSISRSAFSGCTALMSITALPDTPPPLGSNAFLDVPADCAIYVPAGSELAYKTATGWSDREEYIQAIP